jgi:hypothetical protein
MVINPSNGRSGGGFTIFASTWARTLKNGRGNSRRDLLFRSYRVLPKEHSTQPNSGPKVSVGWRSSSGDRPSSRRDSFKALSRNSRSGIEGEGGRMMMIVTVQTQGKFLSGHPDGPSHHTQPTGMPCEGLCLQQLSIGVQGRPNRS